ncbi:MAG: polysaccharide lyase [Alphaproteobacteria bacterium]
MEKALGVRPRPFGGKLRWSVALLLLVPLLAVTVMIAGAKLWMLGPDADITIKPADMAEGASAVDLLTDATATHMLHTCCADSMEGPEDIDGRPAVLFRVRPTDPLVKGNYRAELRLRPNAIGQSVWYRGRIFVPNGWKESQHHVIAMQWHGTRDVFLFEPGRPAPLQLSIIDDRWEITKSWDQRLLSPASDDGGSEKAGRAVIGTAPLVTGRWLDWVFHVSWATDGSGRVRAWLDGHLVVDDRGPNTHRDLIGPYMKAGVYVPEWLSDGPEAGVDERALYLGTLRLSGGSDPFGMNATGFGEPGSTARQLASSHGQER